MNDDPIRATRRRELAAKLNGVVDWPVRDELLNEEWGFYDETAEFAALCTPREIHALEARAAQADLAFEHAMTQERLRAEFAVEADRLREALADLGGSVDAVCNNDAACDSLDPLARSVLELSLQRARAALTEKQAGGDA